MCATARDWSSPTTADEAARRAGGRRAYNARRAFAATVRRYRLSKLLGSGQVDWWRGGAEAARLLGVSRSTARRDLDWLFSADRQLETPEWFIKQFRRLARWQAGGLPKRLCTVMDAYTGFGDRIDAPTVREVADMLGVTRETVLKHLKRVRHEYPRVWADVRRLRAAARRKAEFRAELPMP